MAIYMLSALLLAGVGQTDVTLLFFTANWCQPCAQMQPTMGQLHSSGWDVRAVDVEQQLELVQRFRIENLPTVVIVSGGQEVDRTVGVTSPEELQKRARRAAARAGMQPGSNHAEHFSLQSQSQSGNIPSHVDGPVTQQPGADQPIIRGQSPGLASAAQLAVAGVSAVNRTVGEIGAAPASAAHSPRLAATSSPLSRTDAQRQSITPEQAASRAAAATVRIRVDEGQTTAHGTGTIIDVHGEEALVLTCGHLFRDMQQGSQLSVDLFAGTPQEVNLSAQLIDFRAAEEDIGLISFRLPVMIEPVELLKRGESLQIGQQVFSFGCDHGRDPSRRDTRITNINRYVGAANVEISGAPAIGRSGGGLFDLQGRLIGVCNAADANDDEGIYAASQVIYDQLERIGMSHL